MQIICIYFAFFLILDDARKMRGFYFLFFREEKRELLEFEITQCREYICLMVMYEMLGH